MTRKLLEKVAKAKKINLSYYDHVAAKVNEAYTWIYIDFFSAEIYPGGEMKRCCVQSVKLRVMDILKRGEEYPEEYETKYAWRGEWISDLK